MKRQTRQEAAIVLIKQARKETTGPRDFAQASNALTTLGLNNVEIVAVLNYLDIADENGKPYIDPTRIK
jgi:hypothetical protein